MASKRLAVPAKHLFNGFKSYHEPLRCSQPALIRSMATEVSLPNATLSQAYADAHLTSTPTEPILKDEVNIQLSPHDHSLVQNKQGFQAPSNPFRTDAQCILYDFPSMEPTRMVHYPSTHLRVPFRKDILHRAVIFEGDATRKGTASTKWRDEVRGSGRKVRPQKGTGKARLGDKKSPMLRGGGVAFGPKPRDFSTELPRKVYDLAFRMALSYRYQKGELLVTDSEINIANDVKEKMSRYLYDILQWNKMGHDHGRTLFITEEPRQGITEALKGPLMDRHANAKEWLEIDVKNLLESPRLVIERTALDALLMEHESDIALMQQLSSWRAASTNSLRT